MVIDMMRPLNYNITKYVQSCIGGRRMTIEGLIAQYDKCKRYELHESVSGYLRYVEEEPFYIPTEITDVKTDKKMSTVNPKFILLSAPGATGKSALAKYVAHRFGALYWQLEKIKLGTNSFAGSVLQAVGPENYSAFIGDLNSAHVMLVIDAFDEAEIVSGRKMISSFINDINMNLSHNTKPGVFMLARTETAQYIASFCAENEIPFQHYEIGFFQETAAKEFILASVVGREGKRTPADEDCVNTYFNAVKTNIEENERKSFLGYAPVLQAIAAHIKDYPNRARLISELDNKNDCVSLIMSIMADLLDREQKEKFVLAFKERCQEQHPEFDKWECVYSAEEQLVRVVNYILFQDQKYGNYPVEGMPPQLVDDYQAMLDQFLQQHPFVRNAVDRETGNSSVDFTGPAFRDYALARLILKDEHGALAHMYFEESQSKSFFPSQIFFDCYTALAGECVRAEHLAYVYDSYRAKATALQRPYMHCAEVVEEEGEGHLVEFGMQMETKRPQQDDVVLKLIVGDEPIVFEQVVNAVIDEPKLSIQIGRSGMDARISNASIIVKTLCLGAKAVTVESFAPDGCLIVAHDGLRGENPQIDLVGRDYLRIAAPNLGEYYKLIPYKYDFEDPSNIDAIKIIHALRCILVEFRTHRKDALAKAAERIEFVTVGNSKIKRAVLDYLKDSGVIYEESHLYKVNEERMQEKGIFFAALARNDTKGLERVIADFTAWEKGRKEH